MDREAWHAAVHWVAKSRTWLSNWTALKCMGASQVALMVKNLPASAGDTRDVGLIPWLGRSPEGGCGKTQSSNLAWRIPMVRGAWQATVHWVTKSRATYLAHIYLWVERSSEGTWVRTLWQNLLAPAPETQISLLFRYCVSLVSLFGVEVRKTF